MQTTFDFTTQEKIIFNSIYNQILATSDLSWPKLRTILHKFPKNGNSIYSKDELIAGFRELDKEGVIDLQKNSEVLENLRLKPTRTISGVATVTVLTKPYPCPGECIFCPNDIRMPKSYLSDEPGAQRAERNNFDPYLQTYRRLKALYSIGHSVDKVEVIILGGTWSFYPERYQIWFIKRIFDALNEFSLGVDHTDEVELFLGSSKLIPENYGKNWLSRGEVAGGKKSDFLSNASEITNAKPTTYNIEVTKIIKETRGKLIEDYESATWEELEQQQQINETAKCRNVGLVIETRPDKISPKEVIRIRRLGCTKTQIGIQSLNDEVLDLNHRGHHVQETRYAFKLLRQAGLKIHGHWMANLYGSTPEKDIEDYQKLFNDPDFCPDELKVYPCSLLETAELMDYYQKGLWKPYSFEDLLEVVSKVIAQTPQYCRLSRVIRDIPGGDIVVGNKLTNFREYAEKELDRLGVVKKDIRSREIKGKTVLKDDLSLKIIEYPVQIGTEEFLQFVTDQNQIAGFLRLSLPNYEVHPFMPELSGCAVIREVHVYGGAVSIGRSDQGKAQHLGLGTELIEKAKEIAKDKGYSKIAVISAIGTREYYKKRGFELEGLYQVCSI